jgi:CRISPR system Cascade subunit CasE
MYFSRIELDAQRRDTVRALTSPHVMHAAVENCFPEKPDTAQRRLWRTDQLCDRLYLMLISPQIPNFTDFSKQFCREGQQGETKQYDDMLSRIRTEQWWGFRLRANPVHSVKDETSSAKRGKVYAHVTTRQQKDWLLKKAPACGFALDEEMFDVVQSEHIRFQRQGIDVTLGIAAFEGVLKVTDSSLFTKALTEGIGRAKAYGCGLLTIARRP